jgi:hypothetical protein
MVKHILYTFRRVLSQKQQFSISIAILDYLLYSLKINRKHLQAKTFQFPSKRPKFQRSSL